MASSFPLSPIAPLVICLAFASALPSAAAAQSSQDLKRMTLEQLLAVEVTTTRTPEATSLSPAAVFVITQDDIRRAGVTSLPEALRMAPGIQVARIDASRWSIGMRGFADRLSRAMLVLIDGRAVYSPLFAGTYWEVQDTLLFDIDRIEVIRGPGGTLWGANAVNGIINIITKRAEETQGWLATASAGSEINGLGDIRYGGRAGSRGHMRGYLKGFDRASQSTADGSEFDRWHMFQGGFRGDWRLSNTSGLTVQGDVYQGQLGQRATLTSFTPPFSTTIVRDAPLSGGNLLARWNGRIGESADVQLQTYYDRTSRDEQPVAESRDTFDIDFQQRQRGWGRHDFVWGVAYRTTTGRITAIAPSAITPDRRTDHLFSAFAQDDFTLVPQRLKLIAGTKIEHNEYSGVEVQPSGRVVWTFNAANTVAASVTRAVRTPSRVETDYTTASLANPSTPAFVRLLPNPGFVPEKLIAYELIFRSRPFARAFFTVSAFYNDLEDVLSTELATPFVETSPPPARVILPVSFLNGLSGYSRGAELTADVRATERLRVTANYSYLTVEVNRDPGSNDVSQENRYEGLIPNHQLQVQASLDLPRRVSVDWTWRRVSELPAGPVPAYATSNLRVGWQPRPAIELSITGQNLHDAEHLEWAGGATNNVFIQRHVFAGITFRRP